jgi:hypothetical protein
MINICAVRAATFAIFSALCISQAAAQQPQQKPPPDLVCCHQEKPKCESTCPISDEEQREACTRDCEGRLRACLTHGAFSPKQGQDVVCVKRPGAG